MQLTIQQAYSLVMLAAGSQTSTGMQCLASTRLGLLTSNTTDHVAGGSYELQTRGILDGGPMPLVRIQNNCGQVVSIAKARIGFVGSI